MCALHFPIKVHLPHPRARSSTIYQWLLIPTVFTNREETCSKFSISLFITNLPELLSRREKIHLLSKAALIKALSSFMFFLNNKKYLIPGAELVLVLKKKICNEYYKACPKFIQDRVQKYSLVETNAQIKGIFFSRTSCST